MLLEVLSFGLNEIFIMKKIFLNIPWAGGGGGGGGGTWEPWPFDNGGGGGGGGGGAECEFCVFVDGAYECIAAAGGGGGGGGLAGISEWGFGLFCIYWDGT